MAGLKREYVVMVLTSVCASVLCSFLCVTVFLRYLNPPHSFSTTQAQTSLLADIDSSIHHDWAPYGSVFSMDRPQEDSIPRIRRSSKGDSPEDNGKRSKKARHSGTKRKGGKKKRDKEVKEEEVEKKTKMARPAIHVVGDGTGRPGTAKWHMKVIHDMPKFNYELGAIEINQTGLYYLYGQVYEILDSFLPVKHCLLKCNCSIAEECEYSDHRLLVCALSSPSHTFEDPTLWKNKNTGYMAGIFELESGQCIVLVEQEGKEDRHRSRAKSHWVWSPELTYFGAFLL